MSKYNDLPNAEIDKLLAERIEYPYYSKWCIVKDDLVFQDFNDEESAKMFMARMKKVKNKFYVDTIIELRKFYWGFSPTHPDSNQIERFIFPKLRKLLNPIAIKVIYLTEDQIEVIIQEKYLNHNWRVYKATDKGDKFFNRTKAIACLEAMDKLKEVGE